MDLTELQRVVEALAPRRAVSTDGLGRSPAVGRSVPRGPGAVVAGAALLGSDLEPQSFDRHNPDRGTGLDGRRPVRARLPHGLPNTNRALGADRIDGLTRLAEAVILSTGAPIPAL